MDKNVHAWYSTEFFRMILEWLNKGAILSYIAIIRDGLIVSWFFPRWHFFLMITRSSRIYSLKKIDQTLPQSTVF